MSLLSLNCSVQSGRAVAMAASRDGFSDSLFAAPSCNLRSGAGAHRAARKPALHWDNSVGPLSVGPLEIARSDGGFCVCGN